ncbi:CsbD family protein [Micromonospora sp. NPDC048999]|uniref:CsbD family protein n=1 Tax=Micromonospora sp. NPDC048999 TaxID=3155391 RepID=UPI00340996E1
MSFTDKAKAKAQQMSGLAKERIGDATDNQRMQAEGAREQRMAQDRQREGGRDMKDTFEK